MLLSRSADQLYWMSRYLERAEHTARLIDVQLNLHLDDRPDAQQGARWMRLLTSLHMPMPPNGVSNDIAVAQMVTFDATQANSIRSCISAARENARNVRELISSEMWQQLNRLYLQVRARSINGGWHNEPHDFLLGIKEGAHTFQGITDSTMVQGEGWFFIQAGRYIERASALAMLLSVHYSAFNMQAQDSPGHFLEWIGLLKACTAFEAYCKVYTADFVPERIAEFLLLNEDFPHSVRFSIDRLEDALTEIGLYTADTDTRKIKRLAGRLRAIVDYGQVDEIIQTGMQTYLSNLQRELNLIHEAIYTTFINYPIAREL